jgi:hypothetical protein
LSATNTASSGGMVGGAGWPLRCRGAGDGALTDGLGVVRRHAEPVVGEGLAQRRPGGVQLGRGGVDAAQLLGELEGAFGLGPVGQEAAGLPAHSLLGMQGPLVGVGEGSTSI